LISESRLSVTVEFYGVARSRAGRPTLTLAPGTISEVLAMVEQACPRLAGLRQPDGGLSPLYLLSVNGQTFVDQLAQKVEAGDRVLLLSADAGG
jgi:molybdopterin converting factor small subunit